MSWAVNVLLVLLTWHFHSAFSVDEEIEGPMMPVRADKSLMDTAELIAYYKHKAEMHKVTTEDSYILKMFGVMPEKTSLGNVILQHGYMGSSDLYTIDKNALAFKLSDAGYTVWLTNSRGNVYSKGHTKLKPDDKEFWNFSWQEMGYYDIPAVVDYILNKTGAKAVHYIGHSLGTTMSLVMLSERPEYNAKLMSLILMAPIVYMSKGKEMVGPDGMASEMASKYMTQYKKDGMLELFPRKDDDKNGSKQITCKNVEEDFRDMCTDKLEEGHEVLGGAYMPAGTSFKTMQHLYQMSLYGVMKHFNYSAEENKKRYKSAEPPPYDFSKITVPIMMWNSVADMAIQPKDIEDLVAKLPSLKENKKIEDECCDHICYVFARFKSCLSVRDNIYKKTIEFITKYNKQ